jgi:hypothetical protein
MVPDALGFIVARLELRKPEDCWKIESRSLYLKER